MRNYVLPFVNDRKRLFKPPARYNTIYKESWIKFVKERLSEKFQVSVSNSSIDNISMFMTFFLMCLSTVCLVVLSRNLVMSINLGGHKTSLIIA